MNLPPPPPFCFSSPTKPTTAPAASAVMDAEADVVAQTQTHTTTFSKGTEVVRQTSTTTTTLFKIPSPHRLPQQQLPTAAPATAAAAAANSPTRPHPESARVLFKPIPQITFAASMKRMREDLVRTNPSLSLHIQQRSSASVLWDGDSNTRIARYRSDLKSDIKARAERCEVMFHSPRRSRSGSVFPAPAELLGKLLSKWPALDVKTLTFAPHLQFGEVTAGTYSQLLGSLLSFRNDETNEADTRRSFDTGFHPCSIATPPEVSDVFEKIFRPQTTFFEVRDAEFGARLLTLASWETPRQLMHIVTDTCNGFSNRRSIWSSHKSCLSLCVLTPRSNEVRGTCDGKHGSVWLIANDKDGTLHSAFFCPDDCLSAMRSCLMEELISPPALPLEVAKSHPERGVEWKPHAVHLLASWYSSALNYLRSLYEGPFRQLCKAGLDPLTVRLSSNDLAGSVSLNHFLSIPLLIALAAGYSEYDFLSF